METSRTHRACLSSCLGLRSLTFCWSCMLNSFRRCSRVQHALNSRSLSFKACSTFSGYAMKSSLILQHLFNFLLSFKRSDKRSPDVSRWAFVCLFIYFLQVDTNPNKRVVWECAGCGHTKQPPCCTGPKQHSQKKRGKKSHSAKK